MGSNEVKTNYYNEYIEADQKARRLDKEAEKQQLFAQKVQQQNTTLTSQLELYKERVRVLENIKGDNNYLNEFLKADRQAKHFNQQAQSQFVRDRDIIRDLEKQRDKLDLAVTDYKRKNKELQKTHLILKRQMSENEDRMFMLGPKPLSVYDSQLKHGLGYPNPYTLKQAISQCPKLYLASSLSKSEIPLNVRDTEDTLDDASKSQQKLKENTPNATSSVPASMPTKKVTVYVRKNKQTDNTFANVISNKENVNDVNVANAAKAKLCYVFLVCKIIPKSSDTTYVVLKTRFSEKLTQSKSLDTTSIVSKPKIDVGSASKAKHKVVQIVLWIVDSGCSKHMTGDRSLLRNFIEKFMGTVRFGNDNFAAIIGYGDYVQGNITICHVYYVEGLGHNLFSVGKFCDGDLEVAFRSKTCYMRNLEGDDLLTRGCESNLYIISISDKAASSPVCLMSKATLTKSWLWHRRLSHLNFGTINDLTILDLVDGLPKFKYGKDHLCSACERGKSKKASHPPKLVPSNHSKLELLHMDLCGPMRVASINGKKYILVIVDDYSRYTWVYFLHSKDETPEIIKKFIAQAQLNYKAKVCKIRTDNGTEFKNATLKAHYEKLGIMQQFSTARTPQQNGVVERRNRTLVEAARTMLIFSRLPEFIWAEANILMSTPMETERLDADLQGTPIDQITFRRMIGGLMYLTASRPDIAYATFVYVDHAGCKDDCKSTSGGFQFLGEKLMSWSLKKQDCTAMSTAEAKYVSLSACCTQHSKHTDIRYHFIKEHVEKGTVELYFVGTEYQLADLFTKALPKERFEYLVHRIVIIMAQQQHAANVHPTKLCPSNKRYDLMDANKKVDFKQVQCPPESKILMNIIKDHPLRFSIAASSSKLLSLTLDDFRTIFHLPQETDNNHESFVPPPSFLDMVPLYKNELGFTMELKTSSSFKITGLLRSTRLTPPDPVPIVDKEDEMILQDTLQVILAKHKSQEEQEARENVELVNKHLVFEEIEKMVDAPENVIDDSPIPRNDDQNIPTLD
ncbi:integrase, catalytic region, zinc finger, CCHC-type containing protein [Tanacetum coccineum]